MHLCMTELSSCTLYTNTTQLYSNIRSKRNCAERKRKKKGHEKMLLTCGRFLLWPYQQHRKLCCSSVQLLSRVRLFATPWTAARQASKSITNSWSLLKLMSIEPVMPSSHLILFRPLLHLPSIFPSIRVFSSKFFVSGG